MADKHENSPERLRDWLNAWEIECVTDWERQREVEDLLHQENEQHISQKLWSSFQNSASSIARLYKDGQEAVRRSYETGKTRGHNRRTHELLAWVKKRRRHIRREDLIAFLCGSKSSTPSRHAYRGISSPRHAVASSRGAAIPEDCSPEPDLQTFRDALALQGLDGAMSNISVGRHSSPQPHQTGGGEPCAHSGNSHQSSPSEDFHGIILDEMARRCGPGGRKRTAQQDSFDHSPCWKRSRLWHEDDDPSSLC